MLVLTIKLSVIRIIACLLFGNLLGKQIECVKSFLIIYYFNKLFYFELLSFNQTRI